VTVQWRNQQGVEREAGFVVQITGRFTLAYREDGRVVVVGCEDGEVTDGVRDLHAWADGFDQWVGRYASTIGREIRKRAYSAISARPLSCRA
jgi:hypothetical protein